MVCEVTESLIDDIIIDERFAIALFIEPQSIFTELDIMNGETWNEVSHDALHCMRWNAPDAKEAKNMIYAKGIEVIAHLLEAEFPPKETIVLHALPIVGREFPV